MDPLSLLVAALIAGATRAVSKAADDAVSTCYADLKEAILQRYRSEGGPELEQALVNLEADPEYAPNQTAVTFQLARVGAGDDPVLGVMAGGLMALVEDPMRRLSSPMEEAQHRAGMKAVASVMERHVDALLRLRERLNLDDTELLTPAAGSPWDAPPEVGTEVERLQINVRSILQQMAARIEDRNYADAEEAIQTMPMSRAERERAVCLVGADKQLHVSYRSLKMAVEAFGELNRHILKRISTETSPEREANLMLGNAIIIFEIADFVIRYVQGFSLGGEEERQRLHEETRLRIEAVRSQDANLRARASAANVDLAIREQTLQNIAERDAAVDILESEWAKYLADVDKVSSAIGDVGAKLPTLEVIRDNARSQIDVLQLVSMLQFLRLNARHVDDTIKTLEGFQLAPLSPSRVRRLVGAR